ncbi:NAD(P)(+) transhydrogenase (Re/Si-specific) subunit beta [Aequorivita viscosa]|nr:NAD(P)(+) transhydrogenase (Re/Si-specific) subunit beta [Aequorivita viscosa]
MHAIIEIGYLIATLSFLGGLKFMSSPKNAKTGNLIAATGMVLAVVLTFIAAVTATVPYTNLIIMLLAIAVGTVIGKRLSDKVEMTGMPQLVSLFNATGGGCAMLLGLVEANQMDVSTTVLGNKILLIAGLITGAVALTGSIIAERKLAGKVKDRRSKAVIFTARILLVLMVLLPVLYFLGFIPISFTVFMYVLATVAMVYGVLFVLPIGGADMPVVISLLNSITGIATAFAGFVYGNKVMIAGGIFVGAAGILLTLLMCKAMNRSLLKVLAGTFKKSKNGTVEEEQEIKDISISETAMSLSFAQKVAIIPGYGLAVAQAQHVCGQLQQLLEKRNTQVDYIIHPVAGRMPGHMNVLLAEANVEYSHLKEMDEGNENMAQYDTVLVIGANDVVNPAAENNPDSPVYGMPIIRAHESKQVIVMKRSMGKGYAGVQNDLFGLDNCSILFGDAKVSLQEIVNQLKLI